MSTTQDNLQISGDGTYIGGQFAITTQATTTITAVDTFVKMAGTTTYVDLNHFTGDNDNEFVYVGDQVIEVECKGLLSFSGGNNDQLLIKFRKYDASASAYIELPFSKATMNGGVLSDRSEGVGIFAYTDLAENDRIELWVANGTDTQNITGLLGGLVSIVERSS